MPTQTHISDTHSHGYSHFGTAMCGVSSLLENRLSTGWSFWHGYGQWQDYDFLNLLLSFFD
jgi:hypothetical protein